MRADFHTIFLGAGPAGTGPLMSAIRRGDQAALLDEGALWIDSSHAMMAGSLGQYDILSDTASSVLLECLANQEQGPLRSMLDHPLTARVRAMKGGPLPLPLAGQFLAALGAQVRSLVEASRTSAFLGGATVERVDRQQGRFEVHVRTEHGPRSFRSRRVVVALGGYQSRVELMHRSIAGSLHLADGFDHKTLTSSELVRTDGQARLAAQVRGRPAPRVVILGGSHSAITAAWLALHRSGASFDEGAIQIFCRRLPKIFYPSRAEALADGYRDWSERDVCPVTGRLFRLSGLRLTARDLMRSVRRLGSMPQEDRVHVSTFSPDVDEPRIRAALESADAVIAAFGYRPRLVPFFEEGVRVVLAAERDHRSPLVDDRCRLIAADHRRIADAYGIGLASGFVPSGPMGGEPSFDGQTNGLWLYQNDVGERILDQLLASPAPTSSSEPVPTLSTLVPNLSPDDPREFQAAENVTLPQSSRFTAQPEQPFEASR